MSINAQPIIDLAAELVRDLEEAHPSAELGAVAIVYELRTFDDPGDEYPASMVEVREATKRNVQAVGLLARGLYATLAPDS